MGIIGKDDGTSKVFLKLFKYLYFHFSQQNLIVASAFSSLTHLQVNIIAQKVKKKKNSAKSTLE